MMKQIRKLSDFSDFYLITKINKTVFFFDVVVTLLDDKLEVMKTLLGCEVRGFKHQQKYMNSAEIEI